MAKLNLWEAAGKPTSYNPLPLNNTINIDLNKDYELTFKAKSPTGAELRVSSYANVNDMHTGPVLTSEFVEYKYTWRETEGGQLYINDKNSVGNIQIKDIMVVEKSLGRATINGIDGFRSGKWNLHANAKVVDNETVEIESDVGFQESSLIIPCEPSTLYRLSMEATSGSGFVVTPLMSSGGALPNISGGAFINSSFTTPSDAYALKFRMMSNKAGKFIIRRPMIVRGDAIVPYEPKRGDRMVLPQPGKNLFNPLTVALGKWVSQTTGLEATDVKWNSSDKIDAKSGQNYTISGRTGNMGVNPGTAFYNGSGVFIGGTQSTSFTTPAGTASLRTTIPVEDMGTFQLEEGPATSFEPYRARTTRKATKDTGKNKLPSDSSVWEQGHIASSGINFANDTSVRTINNQPIKGGVSHVFTPDVNIRGIIYYYDANGTFISTPNAFWAAVTTFTTPTNAAFYRLSVRTIDGSPLTVEQVAASRSQIEEGTSATAYESFRLGLRKAPKLPKKNMVQGEKEQSNILFNQGTGSGYDNVWENGRLKVTAGSSSHNGKGLAIPVEVGKTYILSCEASGINVNGTGSPRILLGSGDKLSDYNTSFYPAASTGGFAFTATTNMVWIRFLINGLPTPTNDPVYFWNIQLEPGTAKTAYESHTLISRPAPKGLEFSGKVGEYVNYGSADLRNANIEAEFKLKLNVAATGTHAVLALHTYSTGILINQIGTSLLAYVGHSAAAANFANFFEAGKDIEAKVIFDKTNNTIIAYKDGVPVSGTLYPQYTNYPGIIIQNLYIAGHPSSYAAIEGAMKYMKVKKDGEVLLEYDFANPQSIVGTKVKAKIGPDGTIAGNPTQLNRLARR